MADTKPLSRVQDLSGLRARIAPLATVAYLIVALAALAMLPFAFFSWSKTPFLGIFAGNDMQVSGIPVMGVDADTDFQVGDQIIQIGQQPIDEDDNLSTILGRYEADAIVPIMVVRDGEQILLSVRIQRFPSPGHFLAPYALYLVALVYLGCGVWSYIARREHEMARVFSIMVASVSLSLVGFIESYTTQQLADLWLLALALTGSALLHLAMVYPRRSELIGRYPFLRESVYVLAFVSFALSSQIVYILTGVGFVVFVASSVMRQLTSPSPIEREQTRAVQWGSLISFLPILGALFGGQLGWDMARIPLSVYVLPLIIFPLVIAYTILRYQFLNTDFLLSRVLVYTVLTVGAGASYALIVAGAGLIVGNTVSGSPLLIGILVFLIALLLNPLRLRLQKVVDRLFFRGEEIYTEQLQFFTRELTQMVDLSTVVDFLREYIHKYLLPNTLHIFIHDPYTDFYMAVADESGEPTTDLRFPMHSGLVRMLSQRRPSLFIGKTATYPLDLFSERNRLALLRAQLFIALPGQARLAGWVALGSRRSGESYSKYDLNFLISMCEQVALAIERAQVLIDKDRRVHDMNVLTRVAQGINITLAFDDILELISAQAGQVVHIDDFSITLHNKVTNTLSHVFYLEEDDRLSEHENRILPIGVGLEQVVLDTRRAVITEDYNRECRSNQTIPAKEGLFAWLGVPLNAGAESIGVIAVGSRDPTVVYTEDHLSILQAIADQAAGAIVKARLLEESQRRARQLSTLNEVARSLSSTLEIDPLLNRILHSAVEILNCEAGSLLLLDEDTDDLVFEVAVGPVADDFVGKRMSSTVGLVGKAVQTLEPVIVNNVEQSKDWFDQPDKQTGFSTRGLLVVPMIHKERVMGVIEVLNKRDGMPFDNDDVELLKAFTGQAAVAVENARLYTLTDQELASRVEELSVMQRIDRELNTSLDVTRSMRITLEWAMRQSDTTAGLIGVLEEEGLLVMASEGYETELVEYQDGLLPLDLPTMISVVEDGQLARPTEEELQVENATLLLNARSQLVIPIRRETEVIGLLLLESTRTARYQEDIQAFLTRLCDHAAIAISNAQLYSAVQQANIAKSEFVSFVSHELKTPMTSIKGYTDLLAAGSVGEVTDAQANFLATIRANVTRMATIVSDLADVSRIEAGRLHLEFGAVLVQEVVEEVVRSAQASTQEKEQELVLDIPETLPEVWGDRNRIIQVLTNLVNNAHKYTPEGGKITIRAEYSENIWDPDGARKVMLIVVEDTGIGIKEEDHHLIFQQYFRTDYGKETAPGTGLGLNITRTLVEMQGGQIWFESEYGKGTSFNFTVPIAEADEE